MVKKVLFALVLIVILGTMLGGCDTGGKGQPPGGTSPSSTSSSTPVLPRGVTGTITTGEPVPAATANIGPEGGVIKVTEAGNPLTGLELTIPEGAYPDSRQVSISSAAVESQTFGNNLNPISPLISVDVGGGFADDLMIVKVPIDVEPGQFAMAFLYDEETKTLEGMPALDQDDKSITVATRHFSKFLVSSIDELLLKADIDTGFRPGVNDWQFVNNGSYIEPMGNCAGQSVTALWYYSEQPDGRGVDLFGRYDNNGAEPKTPKLDVDDSLAYRFVSIVQSDINWSSEDNRFWSAQKGLDDELTWKRFAYAMALTKEPQLVSIGHAEIGHAMIAYGIVGGDILIADPNYPGIANEFRMLQYNAGKFAPYNSGANRKDIEDNKGIAFEKIGYRGKRTVVNWARIRERWEEMKKETIGDDKFPAYSLWFGDKDIPAELKEKNETTRPYVGIGVNGKTPGMEVTVFRNGLMVKPDKDGLYKLNEGSNLLGVYVDAKVKEVYSYIDFKDVEIVYKGPDKTEPTGKTVYRLQGPPSLEVVTTPSGSAYAETTQGYTTYSNPDPALMKVTQTVAWELPEVIEIEEANEIIFKSSVAAAQAEAYVKHIPQTGVESWQRARDVEMYPSFTADPTLRIVTSFSAGTTSGLVQYSPDGTTWKATYSQSEAWDRYYESDMKQVLQVSGLWAEHVKKYSPPDIANPLPLSTPVSESNLMFRFRPDWSSVVSRLPDEMIISIRAEAKGIDQADASVVYVVFKYVKE